MSLGVVKLNVFSIVTSIFGRQLFAPSDQIANVNAKINDFQDAEVL